jgi:A/G-specific adenine glycosylase
LRFPILASGRELSGELETRVAQQSNLAIERIEPLTVIKHSVTRFRITLECFEAARARSKARLARGTWRWVKPHDLQDFPLSVTGRKLARLVQQT